jgi:hypothetical protein
VYKDFTEFEANLIDLKELKQISPIKEEKKPFPFNTNKIFSIAGYYNSIPKINNPNLLSKMQAQLLEEIKAQNNKNN